MKKLLLLLSVLSISLAADAVDLTKATIVYNPKDHPLVRQMALTLSEDIERVSGVKPSVSSVRGEGANVFLSTASREQHILTLSIVDPGQIVQKITFE